MTDHIRNDHQNISAIVGVDSRGFIFGSVVALALGLQFVPVRKRGKLPGKTFSQTFTLEYGEVNMQQFVTLENER